MPVTALARKFRIDVSPDAVTWTQLKGVNDFGPQITPTKQDSSDYDSNGWASSEITMQAWTATIKVSRQANAGVLDPGQELVRACVGQFGDAARIYVRWYDKTGGPEAYQGRAIVEWQRSKTGVADLDEAQITLTGDGPLATITNPYTPTSAPVITAVSPANAGTGQQVQITGSGFTGVTGATGVKFGGSNATAYTVVSDSVIVAVLPSGTAGATTVVVTNPVGASNSYNYTRAA